MSATKWIKIVVTVAAIVGATSVWMVQDQTEHRLRVENESLQVRLEQMAQLEIANKQLSNIVTQPDGALSNQQLMELLKLRNEVGMLRRQTNELQKLREQNAQLQAAIQTGNDSQVSQTTNLLTALKPLAVYPKASWAFAGFDTPEDAFQSLNWAAANGDIATLKSNLTPEMQKQFAKQYQHQSESAASDDIKEHVNESTGFRILAKEEISENFVVLSVLRDEEAAEENADPRKLVFQRIDGQWKLAADH
jgi:hypothetical protein